MIDLRELPHLDEFFKVTRRHTFQKRGTIYPTGPRGLYLIHSGQVKITFLGPTRNVSFPPLLAGEFFGESFLSSPRDNERATALTPCEVYIFDTNAIKNAMAQPDFAAGLAHQLLRKLSRLEEFYNMQTGYNIPERLLRMLAYLDVEFGADDVGETRVLPHFTHEYLGEMMGSTREIITSCMGKLRRTGALAYNRKKIRLFPGFASLQVCPEPQRYSLRGRP